MEVILSARVATGFWLLEENFSAFISPLKYFLPLNSFNLFHFFFFRIIIMIIRGGVQHQLVYYLFAKLTIIPFCFLKRFSNNLRYLSINCYGYLKNSVTLQAFVIFRLKKKSMMAS